MPFIKKFIDRVFQPSLARTAAAVVETETPRFESLCLAAEMGYHKLETRQVLSATFNFGAGLLTLDGFDAGQNLTFSQDMVDIGGSTVNAYVFEVANGNWTLSGAANAGIELQTPNRLEVSASLLTNGMFVDGANSIGITQASNFSISNFSISNFMVTDQSIDLNIGGHVTLGNLSLNDTNPLDNVNPHLMVEATGSIDVTGNITNNGTNANSFISLTANGTTSDITLNGSIVSTSAGNITLSAADDISLLNSSTVSTGLAGTVSFIANSDNTAGDSDSIFISDGSAVSSTSGNISLLATGVDGGDITLGSVTTAGGVTINANGSIVDGTAAEIANVIGSRADLRGSSIGSLDDIDINVQNLSFNSPGIVHITDLASGVRVDALSSAGSGSLTANSPLTISADINLTGSFIFTAGDSPAIGDNLTINNNAIVTLTAATNETLDFIAGDDLIFDTGRVVTTGAGTHTVRLIADNEGALDADRGSITNTAGALPTITTNALIISAAAGVGTVDNGLRTNVDSISVINSFSDGVFVCDSDGLVVAGVTNANRNISIAAGGFLDITGAVNAGTGDVRLLANGDIRQSAAGIITANGLGVRQIGTLIAGVNDLDANTRLDIRLDANNDVNVLAAFNAFDRGVTAFVDVDDLRIGTISSQVICAGVTFANTIGLATTHTAASIVGPADVVDGDILLNVGGFLRIDNNISAGGGRADVRLTADGDILQLAGATIIADELGVRQESNALVAINDADSNGRYDVLLGSNNDVNVLGITNLFSRGVIAFNDVDDLTIGAISGQTIGTALFSSVTGLSTTFPGPATVGAGDIVDGDILVNANGFLQINEAISAGAGTADVRLTGDGLIAQSATGIILADELGVRQESAGNIDLCFDNDVNVVAMFNANGNIHFADIDDYQLGTTSAQTIAGVSFTATNGFVSNTGDIAFYSAGNFHITAIIQAALGTVRIIANGDVTQTAAGIITANALGIRQEAAVYNLANDFDANGRFDILLNNSNNDVNSLAARNSFDGGVIVFNDFDDLTIDQVNGLVFCTHVFAATAGVTSTYTGAIDVGPIDVVNGDILINAGGFLQLNTGISAGAGRADVRLTANGDVHQSATSAIIADELGVRQSALALVAANDIDGNTRNDVLLDGVNDVNVVAIANGFDRGAITFRDIDDLRIGDVSGQTIAGVAFTVTSGISTTFTGVPLPGVADAADGDVLIIAGGFLQIDQTINANTADVRLVAGGEVNQLATAIITANELGVRQNSNTYLAANDLDSDGFYDIHLCAANRIDIFGAANSFTGGDVAFDNATGYTVGSVTAQTIDGAVFAGADGVRTTNGDVFLDSPGFLNILAPIVAGSGVVRLVANGDIHQSGTAGIVAGRLGVRQEGTLVVGNDLDGNSRYDVNLDGNNNVSFFAAFNAFDGGVIAFNETNGFTVSEVLLFAIPGKTFALTTGIVTTYSGAPVTGLGDVDNGDILVNTGGYLEINQAITAGIGGAADVRLTVNGDINQNATGIITANELGVRQTGNTLVAASDRDSNGRYDVRLCQPNSINVFAASNQFASGEILFYNSQRLIIGAVSAQTIDGATFVVTTGLVTNGGNVFVQSDGSLQIAEAINAGAGTVRLKALGDIQQTPAGTITANALGVRQESNLYSAAEDIDGNGRFDILLDDANDVNILAGNNAFTNGVFVFNDRDDLTVSSVGAVAAMLNCAPAFTFTATVGITTAPIVGPPTQGPGDVVNGDILLNADGFLRIEQRINAGGGLADVRLVANGDLHQTATGVIIADELGARQQSNTFNVANDIDGNGIYDIILCYDNRVAFFAAENQFTGGGVSFNSTISFAIASVSAQTIGNVTFNNTVGVISTGSQFLQSSTGAINITTAINAGMGTVYLIANGDVLQNVGVTITAAGLGVRQLATAYNVAEDLNGNGFFDIVLTADNAVDNFAAANLFEDGVIAFRSVNNLTIFSIPATNFCDITFAATDGVRAGGDILIEAGGYLNILGRINADNGLNNVRLIANGDLFQGAAGVITANLLGVRQQRLVYNDLNEVISDGTHDIRLCANNFVRTFAATNPIGDVYFHNGQALSVGVVGAQTIGNPWLAPVDLVNFSTTTGIVAGDNAVIQVAGNLRVDAAITAGLTADPLDTIYLEANGSILLNAPLIAPSVRLTSSGDIVQTAAGIITANQLGVRQEGSIYNIARDIDGNGRFEIVLGANNNVNVFAAFNAFADGCIVFNDVDELIVGQVTAFAGDCLEAFATTTGIDSLGDILVVAGGSLTIEQEINADENLTGVGNNDVRLIANGNITQTAAGIIVADKLGVWQNGPLGDVLLCENNRVNVLASLNVGGDVHFHNDRALTIGVVSAQTKAGLTFMATTGIVAVNESIIVNADGSLLILRSIVGGEVRLVADGNITQGPIGTITANVLGVRQQSAAGGNIVLDDGNDVNVFAAFNAAENGLVVFNDIDDLTIYSVAAMGVCGEPIVATVGISSKGDVLLQAGGPLSITQAINANTTPLGLPDNDVRLIANGSISQTATGIIVADQLGVRQLGLIGDVDLCYGNRVNGFAAFNPVGNVHFHNTIGLDVGQVTTQTVGLITFGSTAGILSASDTIISSAASINITQSIVAPEVRLIGNGNITQSATGTIFANQLGVRQTGTTAGLNIILDDGNDVNVLAGYNASERGVFVFNDIDDLTIGAVTSIVYCGRTFATTTGITTTFSGPGGVGAGDNNNGDVLINAGGFLRMNNAIVAGVNGTTPSLRGYADVRLTAAGDVTQAASGIIVAQELGVRQVNAAFVSNIILDSNNDVRNFAAANAADGGVIVFNDTDAIATINRGLHIDQVTTQTIGNVGFATTTGIATTYSGLAMAGVADVDSGDVLINSNGFLRINALMNAGSGRADIRLTANGDLHQTATGSILANELGVRQRASTVHVTGDLDSNGQHDIRLAQANNDVDHLAMINVENSGDLFFRDIDDLTINRVSSQLLGTLAFGDVNGLVSENGTTPASFDGIGNISIVAATTLNDGDNIRIDAGGDAFFQANNKILLTNQTGDRLLIGGNATFKSNDTEVGQDGAVAGNSNVSLGTLTVVDDDGPLTLGTNTADITQDSTIVLAGTSSVDRLILTSSENITNLANSRITVNQVQFNAANGNVFIGNQTGDRFEIGATPTGEMKIGVVAQNASLAVNSSVELNGNVPVLAVDVNRAHDTVTNEFDLGTKVAETLFVTASGHIEQVVGSLDATRLGLQAERHVHLERVSSSNLALAISAKDSSVANTAAQQITLNQLAGIQGSEVNPGLRQSIAVFHQGQLVVDQVVNPDTTPLAAPTLTGVKTDAVSDGSILLVANNSLAINRNVAAVSSGSFPQVTTYVSNGVSNDASRITFGGGSISVTGVMGALTNYGVVNNSQTRAYFGTDSDGDGDIDSFISEQTTKIIRLNGATNTAEQFIQALYGSPGEEGYRVAFVWDSQRRFVPLVGPQENPNLYTTNTNPSEFYNVIIFNQDSAVLTTLTVSMAGPNPQTSVIEQIAPSGSGFNFDSRFEKVSAYTNAAIFNRITDLRVFTTVEVRNDQDINLFVGPMADNSLNSVTETLESAFETSGVQVMPPDMNFSRNPTITEPLLVELPQQVPYIPPFEQPEIRRPEDPGTLSYVAVKIGIADSILEVDGELILKDPTANYEPLSGDDKVEELDANKNEVAKIIAQIEADPNAEAGLWYKIFVDHEDGSGKKDEVLFYYLKTGDRASENLGPDSDFADPNGILNGESSDQPNDAAKPVGDEANELELNAPNQSNDKIGNENTFHQPLIEDLTEGLVFEPAIVGSSIIESDALTRVGGGERLGLSAGTILLATMAANQHRRSSPRTENALTQPETELSFSRFDRLKRRVTSLLNRAK